MAGRKKYNADYKLAPDERGRMTAVYAGERYTLARRLSLREKLFGFILPLAAFSALWLAAGWQNTEAGRVLYIMLPLVAALAPLALLWGKAGALLRPKEHTRRERDRLAALPATAAVFAVFCGVSACGAALAGTVFAPTEGWLTALFAGGVMSIGGFLWRAWLKRRLCFENAGACGGDSSKCTENAR